MEIMEVKLNDKSYEVASGTTLEQFVNSLNLPMQGIAVAIDYEVVPRREWAETLLTDGISLMLIQAVSGG
jgi:sulfur carrier protein